MDGRAFDTLVRATSEATSRRGALGLLLGGVVTAALARIEPTLARKKGQGKNKKRKCRQLNQGCGGKKKTCCAGLTCTDGTCLNPAACVDDDCCPAELEDRCVIRCDGTGDCPGGCSCRGLFPGTGQPRVVCVDDFDLCTADPCDSSDDCAADEICSFADCAAGNGRCFPICVA
jgi:hypothetical protein